jgi:hypothetical protein
LAGKMSIRSRLTRLERALPNHGPQRGDIAEPVTDEQQADRTGEFLWLTPDWERHIRWLARDPRKSGKAAAFRAWDLSVKAAWAAGHAAYHAGLRAQALAVWLTMKPDILDHERTHGRWLTVVPAPGNEAATPEEFDQLPLPERIRLLRSPCLWS